MKLAYPMIAAVFACAPALAAPPRNPPLPPPRPNLEAPAAPAKNAPPPQAQAPDPTPLACAAIENGRALGESLPPIPGENGCGVSSPVRIHGVKLKSGVKLKLTPDAVLNCEMAGVVADFLDEEVARIEKAGDGKVVEVQHAGAYECRGRNRVVGAKLSEHALGNAIDLRALKFSDGRLITIGTDKSPSWAGLKSAACTRFRTVLGPGSDPSHKDHLHLDLRMRKSTTICQWILD